MLNPSPESIDLLDVCERLQRSDAPLARLEGYLEGKTILRDRLVSQLDCSELEAERLIDTLVARGFLRFRGSEGQAIDPGTAPGCWELQAPRPAR